MDEETFEDADKVAEDKSPAERLSVQKTKTYATNHRPVCVLRYFNFVVLLYASIENAN